MSDDTCTDCACSACETSPTPTLSDDPMASMRIGDLRLMVDYVAHTNAYRRFEARVMAAERDPVGAANARYAGGGQRRSLPILDPIDDPAHGPMPDHPGDLAPFVQQEVLFDRGPRQIDEPRVTEETFPQLEALGLEAPEVPLDEQPPRVPQANPIPQLDAPCPMPDDTTVQVDGGIVRTGPEDAPLQHWHYYPTQQLNRNLIVMLPGGAGSPANVHEQSLWMAQAGFRVLTLDWNASGTTASIECRFDEDGERRTDLTDDELNACLIEVREYKNHNADDGVLTSLVAALLELSTLRPSENWNAFLTADGVDGGMLELPRLVFRPNWDRIVLAGYSEGANQTAYNLRQFPVYGAIMVSGGGDFGQVDATPPPSEESLADWMEPLAPDDRRVAMYNHQEGAEAAFLVGWDVDGVPDTQSVATPEEPFYDSFRDANRLCHSCDMDLVGPSCPEPSLEATDASCDAHGSVILDSSLRPAWMYMACRAGRVG